MTVGAERFVVGRIVVVFVAILVMHVQLTRLTFEAATATAISKIETVDRPAPVPPSIRLIAAPNDDPAWIAFTHPDGCWSAVATNGGARICIDLCQTMNPFVPHGQEDNKEPPGISWGLLCRPINPVPLCPRPYASGVAHTRGLHKVWCDRRPLLRTLASAGCLRMVRYCFA